MRYLRRREDVLPTQCRFLFLKCYPLSSPDRKIRNFLSDLYSMGVIIAYKMLQYGIEKREVAIVGRLTKFSCASFVSSHTHVT